MNSGCTTYSDGTRPSHDFVPHFSQVIEYKIVVPVKLKDISKFEKANSQISINVYTVEPVFGDNKWTNQIFGPLYFATTRKVRHINLLLITDEYGNSYYTLIKDMSRLVRSQVTAHSTAVFFVTFA